MATKNKILSYLLATILFLGATSLYLDADSKGFPDGHLTELDRAELPLFYILCFVLAVSSFILIHLASFSKAQNRNSLFYKMELFILFAVLIVFAIDAYLSSILENGQGG